MRSEYNRKNYNTTNPAPNVVAAVMTAVQEEMTVLLFVVLMNKADDAISHITDGTADASKRKIANSGSIDSFLVAQNKRPRSNN